MNILQKFTVHLSHGGGRCEIKGGTRYSIFPAVLMVEGVHHACNGEPLYYPASVLKASASAWNGQPVTVNHPQNANGDYISAQGEGIGHLASIYFQDNALRGEVWLDVEESRRKHHGLLDLLEEGHEMEVSTGAYVKTDGSAGHLGYESFAASVTAIYPDHLALLPYSKGACSWEDGCGVRANNAQTDPPCNAEFIFNSTNFKEGVTGMITQETLPPTPPIFSDPKDQAQEAVQRAIVHLNAVHGVAGANQKIRNMSGEELIILGEQLQRGERPNAPHDENDEPFLPLPPPLF